MPRSLAARAALAVAFLLVAPACTRDTGFDIIQSAHVASPGGAYSLPPVAVDLSREAGAAWDHRSDIKSVRVTSTTAVASSVSTATGTTGSGSIALRPSGGTGSTDVAMGSFTNIPLVNGTWLSAGESPAVDGAIDNALRGDGRLSFVLQGDATASFTADLLVTVHVDVEYKISPF